MELGPPGELMSREEEADGCRCEGLDCDKFMSRACSATSASSGTDSAIGSSI